ncbi:MAG TPA: branched-chain amino acid ABC transporter permease [Azospirillaceae bacterium]|nr:branched-chain amino acid ABC transporter permease [Azospirillaceae bacterium]
MRIATAKETYAADEALFTTPTQRVWLGILLVALVAFPFLAGDYWRFLACLVAINLISATGLMILTGFTGLVSLGHAAFMGVGAYTAGWATGTLGLPFWLAVPLGGLGAAAAGVLFGTPSLRVKGLYLALATIAAAFILQFVFFNWTSVTGGARGLVVPPARVFGFELATNFAFYWVAMPLAALGVLGASNLFRTRIGRAFVAIRDRDISAEVIGIPLFKYKLMSFALASFYAGIAGALWVYFFRVVTPESFRLAESIFYVAAIIVGGLGSVLGAVLGAAFMTLVPEVLKLVVSALDPYWPGLIQQMSPVRTIVFGSLIVGFLMFEPYGLAEIWRRIRRFFHLWPFRT